MFPSFKFLSARFARVHYLSCFSKTNFNLEKKKRVLLFVFITSFQRSWKNKTNSIMSSLVYFVFLLAVVKASRNTLHEKSEVDAEKPKLAGIIVKASIKTLPENTKVDAKKESEIECNIH